MKVDLYHHNQRGDVLDVIHDLRRLIVNLREEVAMLSAEVKAQVDAVHQLTGMAASVVAGIGILKGQIQDLTTKLANVPAAPAQGPSAEDKAALVASGQEISDTMTALQSAIPANVTVPLPTAIPADAPATPPVTPPPPAAATSPADDPQHAADASAAASATPLPGTGADAAASAAEPPVTPPDTTVTPAPAPDAAPGPGGVPTPAPTDKPAA